MAIEITIPRLGWSMEEGTLTEWLKQDGEHVRKGDMLFVLEGDKATQEVESFDEGILRLLPDGPRAGDTVKIGQVVALLVAEGETIALAVGSQAAAVPARERGQQSAGAGAAGHASPAARRRARELKSDRSNGAAMPAAQGNSQGAAQHDASRSTERASAAVATIASPRARRAAAELGIDWTQLKPTGTAGRVAERDVLAAANSAPDEARTRHVPHSAIRRTIAARMVESHQTTAPVTLTTTVDATNLVGLREQFRAAAQPETDVSGANVPSAIVPSYTDLIVKLTAIAIEHHPALNARWEADALVTCPQVHVGIAVDADAGLVVPVVRDVGRLTLKALAAQSQALIARALARQLAAEEMQGGTFTVSNLGAWGIDAFTPIINGPQCAILGVGRISKQPAVVDGQIVPRDLVTLSLTFDHRLVDGGPAARFLHTLSRGIENPAAYLID